MKNTFEEYCDCVKTQRQEMSLYMYSMQFYQKKFEKCIYEGIELAKYREVNVYNICSKKMTDHMKKMNF